jgi:hypothetical protein
MSRDTAEKTGMHFRRGLGGGGGWGGLEEAARGKVQSTHFESM